MRSLWPTAASDVDVEDVYGDVLQRAHARERPYVLLNMVASVDGAIAVNGVSGGLSSAADKAVFFYLRSLADVILVGASTVRAEKYGRARLADDLVARRRERGQADLPRIAVVSRSMAFDWDARLFRETRPYLVVPRKTPADKRESANAVADLVLAGDEDVDLVAAVETFRQSGARLVLCEGGPTLNGQLLDAGLVDELCLTVAPTLVGGLGRRISGWDQPHAGNLRLELRTIAEANDFLLLRYAVKRASQD